MWTEAQNAFNTGDYARAATVLQSIIKSSAFSPESINGGQIAAAAPNQEWLEPVFFMLGASYFNAKDWPNAISTFNTYRQLFPNGSAKAPQHLAQVLFSLAQANLQGGNANASIPLFNSLLALPGYHDKVLLLLADANKRAGKMDDAIALLEKEKASPNINPDFLENINAQLFSFYLDDSGNEQKAIALLHQMDADIAHVKDVTQFNAQAIRLGDRLLPSNNITAANIAAALDCYRRVRNNEQILALQKQQIENLQQQKAANLARIQADPLNSGQLQLDNKDIDDQIGKYQQILAQYQTLPPILPPLFMRIARAYTLNKSLWESAVVYREILRRYPKCKEAEDALYGSIVAFERLKQTDRAQALCQSYLTQYPQGKYADSVGFLRGALAYDTEDFDKAISYFEDCLQNQPQNPRRQQIEVIIGDIKLRQRKFNEAIASYARYQRDYPRGDLSEQTEYRTALALLFGGQTEDAETALRAYLQKYSDGNYVADAAYRLAVVKFADKQYGQAIADCQAWLKKYGDADPQAEVFSLMGDCYASMNNNDEAVQAYIRSSKAAQSADVLNYSIFAAAKLLQKQAKWADIVQMFQDFIASHPGHPTVVPAISWIGRADIKLGKVDEAKQFMADTARQYLNDPTREAVDEIITQLAQLYAHRYFPVPAAAPPASSAPAATAASNAPPAVSDPAQELEAILTIPDMASKPTARARILFAKAELARWQHKLDAQQQILQDMAKEFKPEDLSPFLLGQVGDCLAQSGQPDQAKVFYNYLMDQYDKSILVDYAYNGLGQIAYNQKDYTEAERYFSKALDKGLAASKLKDITLGQAETLLALNRPEEAKPLFEQVASTRAWRGEATALSVFYLGEVQMALGKYAEANAYYQRVFVAYQKYPEVQARAYLKSGEAFEKLGLIPQAVNTYSEMLRNPDLSSFPETSDAKERLGHLAQK
ncbi:MAG TPA: tetratricopeptide repeat protein [Candidatus Methylacidiphilales bacterium]|nr:tetratricopeptide repeat protein [Candidatus Methylacidiphilales bacterium]